MKPIPIDEMIKGAEIHLNMQHDKINESPVLPDKKEFDELGKRTTYLFNLYDARSAGIKKVIL